MAKRARKNRDESRPAAQPMTVAAVQSAIDDAGLGWFAAETPISALSVEDQKSRLGLDVNEQLMRSVQQVIQASETAEMAMPALRAAPTSVDWRNNSGNFVTSIKDQANCGSCVSFATLATIESRVNISCRTPGTARDYSEAYLFYNGCGHCCGTGWYFSQALDFCKNSGVAVESQFPYTPGNQPPRQGVTTSFRISGYSTLSSMAERKEAIAERGPVVGGLMVFQDFYQYRSGIYRHASGGQMGGHAISVVGFDDRQACWICKNSWGTSWGESGYFRMAYNDRDTGMDSSFYFYEPILTCPGGPPGPGPVPGDCNQYAPYLARTAQVARFSPQLRACLRYYICRKGVQPNCSATVMAVVRVVDSITQRCPQLRDGFCNAIG
jgi:C1A family cysteine protease